MSGHKLLRVLFVVSDAYFVAKCEYNGSGYRMLAHSVLHFSVYPEDRARKQLPAGVLGVSHFFYRIIAKYIFGYVTYKGVYVGFYAKCFEGFKTACFLFENKAFETLNSDRCWVAVASEDRILGLVKYYF